MIKERLVKSLGLFLVPLGVLFTSQTAPYSTPTVHVVGAMRNVMWKGELKGSVNLDTILPKANLYGLGPVEYLKGEILIADGKAYQSFVLNDTGMMVEETFHIKAPFFVYAYVENWVEKTLPDSITNLKELEAFLTAVSTDTAPFPFRLTGELSSAKIHIVNLPAGTKVKSPEEAHQGQVSYHLTGASAEIIGFYSTRHKGIFTHHDSNIHAHLITQDKKKMGHLEEAEFLKGRLRLYLPQ